MLSILLLHFQIQLIPCFPYLRAIFQNISALFSPSAFTLCTCLQVIVLHGISHFALINTQLALPFAFFHCFHCFGCLLRAWIASNLRLITGLPEGLVFNFIFSFRFQKTKEKNYDWFSACSIGMGSELEGGGWESALHIHSLSYWQQWKREIKTNRIETHLYRAPLVELWLRTKFVSFFSLIVLDCIDIFLHFFFLKQKSKQTLLVLLVKNFNNFFVINFIVFD